MRVFIAGATGAVGRRLVPLALRAGHQVTGMTRSEDKAGAMRAGGAEAVVFFYPHRRRGVRHTLGDRARRSRSLQHRRQRAGSGCRMAAVSCPDDRCAAAAAHPGMARPAADGRARAGDDERDPWCRQYQAKRQLGWQPRYASWREGFRNGLADWVSLLRSHSRESGWQKIGCMAVTHASRRALRALLSMRKAPDGIKKNAHPEEAAPSRRRLRRLLRTRQLSRRTQRVDPANRQFPDTFESGNPAIQRLLDPGSSRLRGGAAGMTISTRRRHCPQPAQRCGRRPA